MRILNFTLAFVFCAAAPAVSAQSDTATVPARKNEIGISIGSMVLIVLGERPYSQPTTVGYKRLFGHGWAFRTNWGITAGDPNFTPVNWHPVENDTTSIFTLEHEKRRGYSGSIGLEYRVPLWKRWKFIVGGDLQACYIESTRITDEITRFGGANPSSIAPFSFAGGSVQQRVATNKTTFKQGGCALFAGALAPIGKRLWLSAQFRYYLYYENAEVVTLNHASGNTSKSTQNTFNLTGYPLVGDLALYYCF